MTFKRPLPISKIPRKPHSACMDSNAENRCHVCGDKAHIFNYGALSCASCKTFFRRHGFHPESIPRCEFNSTCEITISSRRMCTACRFNKCRAAGMSSDLIRKEDLTGRNRLLNKIKQNQSAVSIPIKTKLVLPTLNLCSADLSSLTTSNWTLLSNVVHAFDSFSPISQVENIIQFLEATPLDTQQKLRQSQQIVTSICESFHSSVSVTADYRIMTTEEQSSLVQRNLRGVWAFYAMVVCHKCNLFSCEKRKSIMKPLYESESVEYVTSMSSRLDPDEILVKLLLMVLSFSSNCFVITDDQKLKRDSLLFGTFRLFGSQNAYVEVMWKYMVYRYGYFESAKRFSNLVKIMLDEVQLSSTIYDNNKVHQNLADEIVEERKKSVVTSGSESIPLWGKTES